MKTNDCFEVYLVCTSDFDSERLGSNPSKAASFICSGHSLYQVKILAVTEVNRVQVPVLTPNKQNVG